MASNGSQQAGESESDLEKLEKKVADLEKSRDKITSIFWVIVVVAGIFGISGAFGLKALQSAQGELDDLKQSITNTAETYRADIRAVVKSETDVARSQVQADAAAFTTNANNSIAGFKNTLSADWGALPSGQLGDVRIRSNGSGIGVSAAGTCPKGYYVVGAQVEDEDGGGPCYRCITGVILVCRPLAVN